MEEIDLFLITSVVNARSNSIYSSDQRLDQLVNLTIRTIKEKVSSHYIVVMEGSELTSDQISKIKHAGANELYFLNVNGGNKSRGELSLILSYFNSNFYRKLSQTMKIKTINKISGRYYLAEDFNFDLLDESLCVIKKTDTGTWSGQGICDTRYYKFPFSYINEFIRKIKGLKDTGLHIDMEHSFYKNEVIPFDKIQKLEKINIRGNLAPNGTEIFD
jgi:hypothetical protein